MNDEVLKQMAAYPRENRRVTSPSGGGGWKVKIQTPQQMWDCIRYVEQNPVRARYKPQRWSFVVPYLG
jgi:hypothetical protein